MESILWTFFFVAARFLGAMTICPLFNDAFVTKMLKVLLAAMFAAIVFPRYIDAAVASNNFMYLGMLLTKEFLLGVILGYLFSIPIWLIENIGNLIDTQRGEQFGAVVNPLTKNPASSISKLLLQGFIAYLASIGGLLFLIKFLMLSFVNWPPSQFSFASSHYAVLIQVFCDYFYSLVVLSLPVLLPMYLLELILGIFSSFIPQLNVTVIAMPLKSLLAMVILVIYVGSLYHFVIARFDHEELFSIFKV